MPKGGFVRLTLSISLLLLGFFGLVYNGIAQETADTSSDTPKKAVVVTLDGAIGPPIADYLAKTFEDAAEQDAGIVVVELDTPGGLVTSTRAIVEEILQSEVPVAVYVSPAGAHAASAGTYIMYGAHIAAMAPGTNMGAATPIELGGSPAQNPPRSPLAPPENDSSQDKQEDTDQTSGAADKAEETAEEAKEPEKPAAPQGAAGLKAVNDMVAWIKSLAELRGRNAEWAEKSVREAASLPYSEALELGVIDVVATSVDDLLEQIDGMTVKVVEDNIILVTAGAPVERWEIDWVTSLLILITNPNIAFIFMTLGTYGLFFELANPGSIFPGVIGAICLILGLYSLSVLPVNAAGVAFLILGITLLVAEAFSPSFGILGVGGLFAFAAGATLLFDTDSPEFELSWQVIAGTTAATGAFFFLVTVFVIGAMRRRVVTGIEDLIGQVGTIIEWDGNRGYVQVDGERWQAVCDDDVAIGDEIIVESVEGLVLRVRPNTGKRSRRRRR